MEEMTKYILNMLEIMETELKLLRFSLTKVAKGVSWFSMGVFLLGIGVLFLAWTIFNVVTILLGQVGAGLITALFILVLGGAFLWQGKKSLK